MASFNLATKYVTLPTGVQLYTETVTAKNAPRSSTPTTIVFAHGLGGSASNYYPLYADLLSTFPSTTLLAFDHSGSGSSPRPASLAGMSWPTALKNLEAFIQQEIPSGNIILVGHSAATILVIQYLTSSAAPISRITHAVLLGGPLGVPIAQQQMDGLLGMANTVRERGGAAVVDGLLGLWAGKTSVEKRPMAIALTRALFLAQPQEEFAVLFADFARMAGSTTLPLDKYPQSVKTLLIWGRDDEAITEESIKDTTARISGAKLVIMDEVGHTPQAEDPKTTAPIIADFLKQ